ncbi:hypothetical protein AAHA92_11626 [Salvia divinorum]|uniref:Uncharacterized protein n=1 Tax=Salvia divinorum TaxID=28513 RepID=A0ABD1HI34_SALDI
METFKLILTVLLLIFSLNVISNPSQAAVIPNDASRNQIRGPKLNGSDAKTRNPNRVDPKRGCGEMSSRSECSRSTKCRWCRSEALGDMCFSKSEAWRLPSQVFSCEF